VDRLAFMIPVVLVPSRIRTSTLAGSEQAAVALGSVPSHSSDCFPVSTQRYRTPSSSGERVVLAYRSSSRRRRHRRDALAQSQTSEPEASRWRCSGSGLLGDSFEPLCRFTCKVSHSARTVNRLSPQRPVRFRLQGQHATRPPGSHSPPDRAIHRQERFVVDTLDRWSRCPLVAPSQYLIRRSAT